MSISISLNSFSASTKAESAKVNSNFTSLETAVNMHESEKTLHSNSDAATITFNLNTSKVHTVTLAGNRTLAVSNPELNKAFIVRLVQDATGSRTVTWWGGIRWPSASAPTLSTTATAIDSFGFIRTGVGVYDGYFLGFDLRV